MSAVTPTGSGAPVDRRALLRGGLVGAAAVTLAAVDQATGAGLVRDLTATLDGAVDAVRSAVGGQLPSAAAWEQIVGHEVALTPATGPRAGRSVTAQVVDVRDVAHTSPHVVTQGEAYSVLLDAPTLPVTSSVTVAVHHPDLSATVDVLPVNGDGSWEAVVDRRHIVQAR